MADSKIGTDTFSGVPGESTLGPVTSDEARRRYDQRVVVSEAKRASDAGYSGRTVMSQASDTARGLGAETTTFKANPTSEPESNTEEQR